MRSLKVVFSEIIASLWGERPGSCLEYYGIWMITLEKIAGSGQHWMPFDNNKNQSIVERQWTEGGNLETRFPSNPDIYYACSSLFNCKQQRKQ